MKPDQRGLIRSLEEVLPDFVRLVLDHRPASLKGRAVRQVFPIGQRQPAQLRQLYQTWMKRPDAIYAARPSLVFAAVGQARADRTVSPFGENRLLSIERISGARFAWEARLHVRPYDLEERDDRAVALHEPAMRAMRAERFSTYAVIRRSWCTAE